MNIQWKTSLSKTESSNIKRYTELKFEYWLKISYMSNQIVTIGIYEIYNLRCISSTLRPVLQYTFSMALYIYTSRFWSFCVCYAIVNHISIKTLSYWIKSFFEISSNSNIMSNIRKVIAKRHRGKIIHLTSCFF